MVMANLKFSETLLENLRQSLCIPWCGAGLSKACDLPLWGELVQKLMHYSFASNFISTEEYDELRHLQARGKYDDIVDFCRLSLGEIEYSIFLERLFGGDIKPSRIHECLAQFPVPAMFTTNYDRVLENILIKNKGVFPVLTAQDASGLWRQASKKEFFLLKIHGDISKPGTVILSSSDYTKHVFGNQAFMTFLTNTLLTKSMLFIGTSLNDVYVKRMLEETMFITGGLSVPHFAILANVGTIEKRMLRERFNIHVIAYTTTSESDHVPAICHILQTMLHAAAADGGQEPHRSPVSDEEHA